jgi:NAD(P)-dependent dehydrogenase (short-subunit alcohol dehydrogenase family)
VTSSMRLKDKTAIITGGGTGIGRATAILFAREGAKVMIVGRRTAPLESTVSAIKAEGGQAAWLTADISKANEIQTAVRETIKLYGRIDILFNNAAVFTGIGKTIVELTEDEWDALMAVNLKGVFLCCKYVIPHMIDQGGGAVINCSSIAGHIGQRHQPLYNAAKGGVELLTKCMALDFAEKNVRVNAVCPAWVEIDFNKDQIAERRAEILKLHPIGRLGQPEDVAPAVLYLASDESSWVTGASVMIDGGYTAQ